MDATQIVNGGGRIHPKKCLISLEAHSHAINPRGTGGYIGKKKVIVKADFPKKQATCPQTTRPATLVQKLVPGISPARFVTRVANKRFNLCGI